MITKNRTRELVNLFACTPVLSGISVPRITFCVVKMTRGYKFGVDRVKRTRIMLSANQNNHLNKKEEEEE